MKNVLVLGGTGFVGGPVCEVLLRQGWQVTVPTRQRSNAELLQRSLPEVRVLQLDVHDEAALTQALTGQQAVVNLVAILHGTADAFEKVHVDLPRKLVRACSAAGIRQMVHISALGADAAQPKSAPSMYLRSKGQGEAVLLRGAGLGQQANFDLTILRPSVIFGVGDKFLNVFAQLQQVLPVMPLAGATTRFQPVWVQDVMRHTAGFVYSGGTKSPRLKKLYEDGNIESRETDITGDEMLKNLGQIPRQDISNMQRQQRGAHSMSYQESRLATEWESIISNMHRTLDRWLSS